MFARGGAARTSPAARPRRVPPSPVERGSAAPAAPRGGARPAAPTRRGREQRSAERGAAGLQRPLRTRGEKDAAACFPPCFVPSGLARAGPRSGAHTWGGPRRAAQVSRPWVPLLPSRATLPLLPQAAGSGCRRGEPCEGRAASAAQSSLPALWPVCGGGFTRRALSPWEGSGPGWASPMLPRERLSYRAGGGLQTRSHLFISSVCRAFKAATWCFAERGCCNAQAFTLLALRRGRQRPCLSAPFFSP